MSEIKYIVQKTFFQFFHLISKKHENVKTLSEKGAGINPLSGQCFCDKVSLYGRGCASYLRGMSGSVYKTYLKIVPIELHGLQRTSRKW